MRIRFISDAVSATIPNGLDLEGFRQWVDADDFPRYGDIWYLKEETWADLGPLPVFTHDLVKARMTAALAGLAKGRGVYLTDAFLTSTEAEISGRPDGLFLSSKSLLEARVRVSPTFAGGYDEVCGSPDVVLEVVSPNSVLKDKLVLRRAYREMGVREYWLVDAREEPLAFDILRHPPRDYTATRRRSGWMKSAVFGKSFRLTQTADALGNPSYTLSVR